MIYLASPYSDPDATVRQARYEAALDAVAWLVDRGIYVYSPIVHFHNVALKHGLATHAEYWQGINLHMLRLCDTLGVLLIPGWKDSKGVLQEIAVALSTNKFLCRLYTEPYRMVTWREEPPAAA